MKGVFIFCASIALSFEAIAITVGGFVFPAISPSSPGMSTSRSSPARITSPQHSNISTHLFSSQDKDRIKKAGAGLTTVPPGDLCLYDPDESGKLQGSHTLLERIRQGASFGDSIESDAVSAEGIVEQPLSAVFVNKTSRKEITTNLTKVIAEMDSRVRSRGRSQY